MIELLLEIWSIGMFLTIRKATILLAFFIVATSVLVSGSSYLTYREANFTQERWSNFEQDAVLKSNYLDSIREEIGYGGMIHQFKNMILRRNVNLYDIVLVKIKKAKESINDYRNLEKNETLKENLSVIEETIVKYENAAYKAKEMIEQNIPTPAIDNIVKIDDSPAIKSFKKLDEAITEKLKNVSQDIKYSVYYTQYIALRSAIITAAVLFFLLISVLYFTHFRLTKPMIALGKHMDALAAGSTNTAITGSERKDEFGSMAWSIRSFVENTFRQASEMAAETTSVKLSESRKQTLDKITGRFDSTFSNAVAQVKSVSDVIVHQAQLVNVNAQTSADRMQAAVMEYDETAKHIEMIASSSQEMMCSIDEIAANTDQSVKIAEHAVINVEMTASKMAYLEGEVQKVGSVISLIENIANQTNLLALNAMIEAARAGDEGRGFAVVASEVKSLATQTGAATEEISRYISSMQSAARHSADSIETIKTNIQSFDQISTAIATAIEQQRSTTGEINRNIQEISSKAYKMNDVMVSVQDIVMQARLSSQQTLASAHDQATEADRMKAALIDFKADVAAA